MAMTFPSSPTVGQTYSVSGGPTYTWDGSVWKVLTPGQQYSPQVFTATAGQTTFTISGGYVIGAIDVFRNGVKLVNGQDYTATDLATVVLIAACSAGDTVEVIKLAQILYTDALKASSNLSDVANAATALANLNGLSKSGGTVTGNLNVDGAIKNGAMYENLLFVAQYVTFANGIKIKTNLPAASDQFISLFIKGYDYRTAKTIDLTIVWYAYSVPSFLNYSASSAGNWTPNVRLGNEGGKQVVFFDTSESDGYYLQFTVSAQVLNATQATMQGWTCVDEAYSGSNTVYPAYSTKTQMVVFPATQNASSNPNALDDYEEGTWTPVFSSSGTQPTFTYVSQNGFYTKVGDIVHCRLGINVSITAAGSGTYYVSVPFQASAASSSFWQHCPTGYRTNIIVSQIGVGFGTTLAALYGSTPDAQVTPQTGNITFALNFSYKVA